MFVELPVMIGFDLQETRAVWVNPAQVVSFDRSVVRGATLMQLADQQVFVALPPDVVALRLQGLVPVQ